jgi:hypothetical protein
VWQGEILGCLHFDQATDRSLKLEGQAGALVEKLDIHIG